MVCAIWAAASLSPLRSAVDQKQDRRTPGDPGVRRQAEPREFLPAPAGAAPIAPTGCVDTRAVAGSDPAAPSVRAAPAISASPSITALIPAGSAPSVDVPTISSAAPHVLSLINDVEIIDCRSDAGRIAEWHRIGFVDCRVPYRQC